MKPVISRSAYYALESGGTIPGHVILRTQPAATHLSALPAEALTELGPLLARTMSAVQRVIGPERIYILRFGEEVEAIHFHLFPRTREMAALYQTHHPELSVSGAQMFDWARRPEIRSQLQGPFIGNEWFAQIQELFFHQPVSPEV